MQKMCCFSNADQSNHERVFKTFHGLQVYPFIYNGSRSERQRAKCSLE